jgi:hypothetical protein
MHFSIGPWSRVLRRMDAIPTQTVVASIPRTRKRALQATPENTQPPEVSPPMKRTRFNHRATETAAASARLLQMTQPKPSTTTDPFELLPTHILADILQHLSPLEVISNQRVSKAWRVVLASEYIYTLALRWHFPFSSETQSVWKLHNSGERYPAAAVDGYRAAAARYSRVPRDVKTFRTAPAGYEGNLIWTMERERLVFCEDLRGGDKRIGIRSMSDGPGTIDWINLGRVEVVDLTTGGGLLRVYYRWNERQHCGPSDVERCGTWMRLYDLSDLSLKWKRQMTDVVAMVGNMTETCTSYLTMTGAGFYGLHLLSLSTGEQMKSLSITASLPPKLPLSSFLTPNNDFVVTLTDDSQLRIFSTETGVLVTSIPIHAGNHPAIRYHFSEATNTLSVTDEVSSTVWMVSFRDNDVKLRDTVQYTLPFPRFDSSTGNLTAVISPEGKSFGVYVDVERLKMDVVSHSGDETTSSKRTVDLMEALRMEGYITGQLALQGFQCDERWAVARCLDGNGTVWVVVDFGTDVDLDRMDCSDESV